MNTTTPPPTPETDAEVKDFDAPWLYYVNADFARKLERERDEAREQLEAMREAIKEAIDSLNKCSRVIGAPKTYEWVDEDVCDASYNSAQTALAKLQPFIEKP